MNKKKLILYRVLAFAVFGLIIAGAFLLPSPPSIRAQDAVFEDELFDLVNEARAEEGLEELTYDPALYEIALDYCREMYQENAVNHEGFESRVDAVRSNGYSYVGENLAAGYTSPQALLEDWLSSPGHRDNILNPHFFGAGLACFRGYTCQIFGGSAFPFILPLIPSEP